MKHALRIGFLLLVIPFTFSRGQDPVLSHFYACPMQLNPAMTGVDEAPKLFLGYRNQWPGAGSPYVTYRASFEQYMEPLHGGMGMRIMNDVQAGGLYSALSAELLYSYHFKVSRQLEMAGGIEAGIGQRLLRTDGLVLGDMIDPLTGDLISGSEQITGQQVLYPDLAVGMAGFWRNFYGGIALHHLTKPIISDGTSLESRLARKLTVHIGGMIPIYERRLGKEVLQLSPNIILIQQQNVQQINYGLEVLYKSLFAGLWARNDITFSYGTLILSTGYGSDTYRLRYSYDIMLSRPEVKIPDLGSHELSFILIFESGNKRNRHRAIKCPKI